MSIRVVCPYCSSRLKAPPALVGTEVRCRRCKGMFTITPASAASQSNGASFLPWALAIGAPVCLLGAVVAFWLWTRPAAVAAPSEHHWHHDDHRQAELDQQKAQVEQELARLREKEAEAAARKEKYVEERKTREEQARQQQLAEEARIRAQGQGTTREAMLERAEQASRRMTKYIEHEIDQARAAPAPGLSPAASAGQRTLVLNGASALLRMVQDAHVQGKLDKFTAFDLLNNAKFEWNAPLYRDAVHAEAAHLAVTFGDAIPSGRKADQPVTLGAAWECCTKLANP